MSLTKWLIFRIRLFKVAAACCHQCLPIDNILTCCHGDFKLQARGFPVSCLEFWKRSSTMKTSAHAAVLHGDFKAPGLINALCYTSNLLNTGFSLSKNLLIFFRSVGPAPELVRQREAKWISIISQWDHILLKKASKVCGHDKAKNLRLNDRWHLGSNCFDVSVSGQSPVSERHPSISQSKVLASAVWSNWQDETERNSLPGKKLEQCDCGCVFTSAVTTTEDVQPNHEYDVVQFLEQSLTQFYILLLLNKSESFWQSRRISFRHQFNILVNILLWLKIITHKLDFCELFWVVTCETRTLIISKLLDKIAWGALNF